MQNFHDFDNVTISKTLAIGAMVDRLLNYYGEGIFTSAEYDTVDLNLCTLNTLRKHKFVTINHVVERTIFVVKDNWDTTIVDMTMDQYKNLPDFFKSQVNIEKRITNYYELNIARCADFVMLCHNISAAFN